MSKKNEMLEFTSYQAICAISNACNALDAKKEEVNRLNVFPVPDGDTGTNMSLTIKSVVENVSGLGADASQADRCRAITTGALMGARGNSGVITSQILRGLCEGLGDKEVFGVADVDKAFQNAVEVAFKAVRKPVKGTILTVLEDVAAAAKHASKKKMNMQAALEHIAREAYASVERTPDFLPVLKENGVVDAGGYGLAILIDNFIASILGKESTGGDVAIAQSAAPKVEIEQINDWEGSKYRYCNEFLVDSDTLDIQETLDFLATMGDCELCVGAIPKFKVHVHSNTPDKVLAYFLARGQISEVFIHNMQLQSADRNEKLKGEGTGGAMGAGKASGGAAGAGAGAAAAGAARGKDEPKKHMGVVAVAPGSGNAAILESMGVDVVVSGGQTMNPSTSDILNAIDACHAENVIVLPNNSNIIMAANTAKDLAQVAVGVVPTKSVPAAFTALFEYRMDAQLEENVSAMTDVLDSVSVGEVTHAIKDSKDAHDKPIKKGDVIGIANGKIETEGKDITKVVLKLLETMNAEDADACTLLAGEDFSDRQLSKLASAIEKKYDDLEVDAQRGEQSLYPVIFSVE